MKSLVCLALALLVLAAPARAQSIDKWQLRIYLTGAVAPLQAPADLLVANVSCGLPAALVGVTVNPNVGEWGDPVQATRFCRWTDPGTGALLSLPFGAASYEATLQAWAATLFSAETPRAPFTRPGATPLVPTSFRVLR